MSNEAMTLAWKAADAPSDPGPMFVLIVLADHGGDHAGEDFRAFPSVERIMQRTKYKRSAVEGHLTKLVSLGWISRKRRTRPDGRKGVYDYELHRDEVRRAQLRTARAAIVAAGGKPSGEASDAAHPCLNSEHGPCVNSEPTMREIHVEPCVNSEHHEPSVEPSEEPPPGGRAREALVSEIEAAMDRRTVAVSDRAAYRCAVHELVEEGADVALLPGCIRRWAADPLFASRKVPVPLERWLRSGQWRAYLPQPELALTADAAPCAPTAPPGEVATWMRVMADMQALMGEASFGSWLGPASLGQIGEALFVVARNGTAERWLREHRWPDLTSAWARHDATGRTLVLISKSDFEARVRRGGE